MTKQTKDNNNTIEKVYLDIEDKKSAEELKKEIIKNGVDASLVNVRKTPKGSTYKLTVNDGQNQLPKIIRMLASDEYGMSLEEIEKLFNIKLTIGE